jgi:asparagine synthase (glutamine-hydrolysing)
MALIDVQLIQTGDHGWKSVGNVSARGMAVTEEGGVLHGADLARYFSESGLESVALSGLHGSFAVVQAGEHEVRLATDVTRSIPLFYGFAEGAILVSDDAYRVARRLEGELDEVAAAEFMLLGYTVGSRTLHQALRHVQAAEIVLLREGSATCRRYFPDSPAPPAPTDLAAAAIGIAERTEAAVERVLQATRGRRLVVPLSGGLDSRLLAWWLREKRAPEVVCYTYGRPSSFEVRASREVAERLGFAWHFVPFSAASWYATAQSEAFDTYREFASQLSVIEHEQDWPAIASLLESGVIDRDAVVLPGLSPTHVVPSVADASPPIDALFERHYRLWRKHGLHREEQEALKGRLREALGGAISEGRDGEALEDRFLWQERQSKLIVGSVRVYDFFEMAWALPLWDRELASFWLSLPAAWRKERRVYRLAAKQLLGDLFAMAGTHSLRETPASRVRDVLDIDLQRFGMWMGRSPILSSATWPIRRLEDGLPDVGKRILRPWRRLPLYRATVNGVLSADRIRRVWSNADAIQTDSVS